MIEPVYDLYPQICEFRNLWLAWRKARRGKRHTAAADFECCWDAHNRMGCA
jgi:hypothetical protein